MTANTPRPRCVHVWDTETDEFATYTPDPGLDQPWVIHECVELGCHALRVTRPLYQRGWQTIVYEVPEDARGVSR